MTVDGKDPDSGPVVPPWAVSSEPAVVLRRAVAVVRHRYPVILLVLGAISCFGFVRLQRAPTIYEATVKLLVEPAARPLSEFRDVSQPSLPWWADDYYITQAKLVESRVVLEKVLQDPQIARRFASWPREESRGRSWGRTLRALLHMAPPHPPEPWERLRSTISARYLPKTQMIRITARSAEPHLATRVVNAVAEAFVEFNMEKRMEQYNEAYVFLMREKKKVEEALHRAERTLQEFREQMQLAAIAGDGEHNPVAARVAALNERLTQVELERVEAETAFRLVQRVLESGAEKIDPEDEALFALKGLRDDPAVAEIRRELREVEAQIASLRDVYGPRHPRMQAVLNQKKTVTERLRVVLQEIVGALEKEVESLRAQEAELRKMFDEAKAEAVVLGREGQKLQFLRAEVERQRRLFEVLVQRLSEVKISSEFKGTSVTILEKASVARIASGADKIRGLRFYFLAGLFLGLGAAFGVERLDDRVKVPEDLRDRVGMKVLGVIPYVSVTPKRGDVAVSCARITSTAGNSSVVEAFRALRTAVFFRLPAERYKIIMVTSAVSGEGKSAIASNLALSIARSGKRVLLVDGDFHRPLLHRVYRLEAEHGLSTLLTGASVWERAVQQSALELDLLGQLDILPAGPAPVHTTELLESKTMEELLERMKKEYDRVIIDTPPVLLISDTLVLSRHCDAIIMVVRAFGGSISRLRRARDQLLELHAEIAGAVLNSVRLGRFSPYYSDYYYHGHTRYWDNYYGEYARRSGSSDAVKARSSLSVSES